MIEERKINYYVKKHNYLFFSFLALGVAIFLTILPRATFSLLEGLVFLSLSFLVWSIVHHYFDKSLHWEVMIEYLLIIALVLIIMYSFLV